MLAGHLSLLHRNPAVAYGVDNILASLLWLLCLAPMGQTLSLDRWRATRRLKLSDLTGPDWPCRAARVRRWCCG